MNETEFKALQVDDHVMFEGNDTDYVVTRVWEVTYGSKIPDKPVTESGIDLVPTNDYYYVRQVGHMDADAGWMSKVESDATR